MRIFCNGCSYTWGSELKDHKKSRYSTLLGQMFDAEVVNIASSGTSLHRLLRTTYESCDPSKYDLAILQFTCPARTEYFVDGWDEIRERCFMRVRSAPISQPLSSRPWTNIPNRQDHIEYQESYYRTAFSCEMLQTFEYMVFQGLQDYFARHNVPLVMLTINPNSSLPFDLNLKTDDIPKASGGHPNELGHRFIAKKLEPIIKERLDNRVNYVDAKKSHLHRLKQDHEKILEENRHTDYN